MRYQHPELIALIFRRNPGLKSREVLDLFPPYAELLGFGDDWEAGFIRAHYRQAVHCVFAKALRDGVLTRAEACERCGETGRIEGHHDDYDAPLAVKWVCKPCHRIADVERRRRERPIRHAGEAARVARLGCRHFERMRFSAEEGRVA